MDPNDLKRQQSNRVATPMKIDENGNVIKNDNAFVNNNYSTQNNVVLVAKEKKKSSLTTVFIVILLLIFAIIAALVCYIIVPNYIKDKENNYIVKPTTSTKEHTNVYEMAYGQILEGSALINIEGDYEVSEDHLLSVKRNKTKIDILVNNKLIDTCDFLHSNAAVVEDLLLLTMGNNDERSTKLVAVSKEGEVVYILKELNTNGMIITDNTTIQYSRDNFKVSGSRVNGTKLYLDNTDAINICEVDTLSDHNIDETFPVIANYYVNYLGNHKFSNPIIINSVNLGEYKKQNNLCN